MYVCHLYTSSLNQKKHFLYNELAILRFPHLRRDFKDCTLKKLLYPKIMSYCKSVSSSFSIRCWLSTEDHFIWVFLGPVVAIIVVSRDPFSRVTPWVENWTFVSANVCKFYLIKFSDKMFGRFFAFKKLHNYTKLCHSHLDQLNCPRCCYEGGNWFRVSNIDANGLWTREVSQHCTVTIFTEYSKGSNWLCGLFHL